MYSGALLIFVRIWYFTRLDTPLFFDAQVGNHRCNFLTAHGGPERAHGPAHGAVRDTHRDRGVDPGIRIARIRELAARQTRAFAALPPAAVAERAALSVL